MEGVANTASGAAGGATNLVGGLLGGVLRRDEATKVRLRLSLWV